MIAREIRTTGLAGAIVTHRPPASLVPVIDSCLGELRRLYVIDNSAHERPSIPAELARHPVVKYVPMPDNQGIAAALNRAVREARADGFAWLLALDQDSRPTANMIENLRRCVAVAGNPDVAIVTPVRRGRFLREPAGKEDHETVRWAMTSGSLIRLEICERLGLFDADLFIDGVDHEYCMRVRKHGYRIVRANRALLLHEPGAASRTAPGGFVISNHEPERRYYMIRNRFVIARRHGVPLAACAAVTLLEALMIGVYEDRKREKLRMMWRGFGDFRRGSLGPLRPAVEASTDDASATG